MSNIGEFELIGRIAAACHLNQDDAASHSERSACHPARPSCHPDFSPCHPERSEESGVAGIGDDCAVIPQRDGIDTLVTTDLLIEDRHFLLSDISPYELGWKSAAVNISDIAAMGGKPTASFLSIALPPASHFENFPSRHFGRPSCHLVDPSCHSSDPSCHPESPSCHPGRSEGSNPLVTWVDQFIAGFRDLSARFGVPLLGGDTSASPDKLFINVTVLGECPHGQAVKRSGAHPGDLVCVTGPLGDSAAGLKLVLERFANAKARAGVQNDASNTYDKTLIRRHYLPMPRVELGRKLAALPGVHAMMDISDGIASDLRHILEASSSNARPDRASISAEVDLNALPLSDELKAICAERGWDPFELAVSGGEDYELLFTAEPGTQLPEGCTVIGRIVDSRSKSGQIRWLGSDKEYKGFTHF